MQLRHVAVLILTALVITSGATAAMAAQGGNPLNLASGPQHSSHDHVDREGDINVSVAGNVTPGNEVTLTATLDGQPVRFATVTVNGVAVGETDANGSITVTVPDADEFEVEADSEEELSIPLNEEAEDDGDDREDKGDDSDEAEDGDADDALNVTVDGNVTPGSNVTIVVTQEGYPIAGASVTVNGEQVGETDANGTVTATVPEADEFEIEAEFDEEGKLKVLLEEDEGEDADESGEANEEHEDEEAGQIDLIVAGTLEPGENLSVTAMHDGNPIPNATVTVNGDAVGETDANGSITVEVPDADELEIEVTADDREAELTVDFEEAEDDDHDSDDDEEEADDEDENDGNDEG